jgi:hypothetical protein
MMASLAVALALLSPRSYGAEAESLVAQASEQVRRLEALADLAASPDLGGAGRVRADQAAAYCAGSPMTIAGLPIRDRDLLYACQAFVHGDPGRCLAMPGAFASRSSKRDCLGSLEHLSLFVGLEAPGDASRRSCESGFGIANPKLEPAERARACAALSSAGDETARCLAFRDAVPRVFEGASLKDCADHVAYLLSGRGCDGFHPASDQKILCSAFADFRKGDCGSDYLCRALKGDASACDSELALRVSSACASSAPIGGEAGERGHGRGVLLREIEATISWAALLPLLDQGASDALSRLHLTMLGRRTLDPEAAVADMRTLRLSVLDEVLSRAERLGAAASGGRDAEAIADLRRRAGRARERLAGERAQAAGPAADWKPVDSVLAEAREAVGAFGRCAEPGAGAPSAAAGACVEKVLSDRALKRRYALDLVVRQLCASLSAGRPDSCDALADVPGDPESGQRMCRRLYSMSRFSIDMITGSAGAAASCAAWSELAPTFPPPDLIARVCGSILKGEYERACGLIAEWKTPGHGYSPTECGWEMQSVLGAAPDEICAKNHFPGSAVCAATRNFKAATAAGDPKLCGGDPLCRAMRGDGRSACARLDEELRAKACAAGVSAEPPPASAAMDCETSRSKAVERLAEAGRRLKEAGRADGPDFEVRRGEISELEDRRKEFEAAAAAASAPANGR